MNSGRLLCLGDIHGCASILRVILKDIDPQPDDHFVFLGDLINRGTDSRGVINQIIELSNKCQVTTILGNHEEMLLGAYQGGKDDIKFFLKFGGDKTLASYGVSSVREIPGDHLRFFAECKDYFETDKFICVHAACHPNIPLEKNSGEILRWMKLEEDTPKHISGKTVVCGHTAQKQVLDLGHLLCIDTGCGIWPGGRLTAIDLNSGVIWQAGVRSRKASIKQRKSDETDNG